ncbi:MAG: tetraacyldisaccharide 4'-kinase [Cytophagia bacterium]|nr:MAG: tetraacyldisaccharide 4'-kinase [Cytophagia bacterium]
MTLLKILLLPFSFLYQCITDVRNYMYDKNYRKSFRFNLPVINVGNLTVGGTGKTPHVEYLLRLLLNKNIKIGTLSRGYGRKTKGFILADETATAEQIGDEPLQFYHQFKDKISVSVGEERALAIPYLLYEKPDIQVIILDDAFQHRPVNPSFNILLTDYHRLFYKDFTFPAGRLRESRKGAKRADVVIVTKCNDSISVEEKREITQHIHQYTKENLAVFFTNFRYDVPKNIDNDTLDTKQNVILISGIAQPKSFENYAQKNFIVQKHFIFPDHYFYTDNDIQKINQYIAENPTTQIITTEKDFTKLRVFQDKLNTEKKIFYLPIQVNFLFDDENNIFDALIEESIKYKK